MRIGKSGAKNVSYVVSGTQILSESDGTNTTYYIYDDKGLPIGIVYKGVTFTYRKNLQGDIIAILNSAGTEVVNYTYNAWGRLVNMSGSGISTVGQANPFRYRGYYYDSETGYYYLNSRYYDPITGRFLNADSVMSGIGGDVRGCNLYAYCFNNPVMYSDPNGNWICLGGIIFAIGCFTQNTKTVLNGPSVTSTGSTTTLRGPSISSETSLGILSRQATGSLGFASGTFRGQYTQEATSSSLTSGYTINDPVSFKGGIGKASAVNYTTTTMIGTKDIGITNSRITDVGSVEAKLGIQYNNGIGFNASAKASVATGIETYGINILGWKIEGGFSVRILSVGNGLTLGSTPSGGWGISLDGPPGLYGIGCLIRITPP